MALRPFTEGQESEIQGLQPMDCFKMSVSSDDECVQLICLSDAIQTLYELNKYDQYSSEYVTNIQSIIMKSQLKDQ